MRKSSGNRPPHLGHTIMCSIVGTYSWMQHLSVIRFPYSPVLTTVDCRKKPETLYISWEKSIKNAHMHTQATLIPTELLSHDNE